MLLKKVFIFYLQNFLEIDVGKIEDYIPNKTDITWNIVKLSARPFQQVYGFRIQSVNAAEQFSYKLSECIQGTYDS